MKKQTDGNARQQVRNQHRVKEIDRTMNRTQPKRNRNKEAGFTLVELMLVVVILGILAAVVLPNLSGMSEKAKINAAKAQISTLETALDNFELDTGSFPTTDQGLQALVADPGIEGWSRPYLRKKAVPKDPWNNEYIYKREGERGVNFEVFSMGPDGQENTDDDIGNWIAQDELN